MDTPTGPKVAAIYTRVSTEEQARGDHLSLSTQAAKCRQKAIDKGFTVDERYVVEERHSGTDLRWDGTKLMQLAALARSGAFDVLICYNMDRFCRAGPDAFFEQMKWFESADVEVVFVLVDLPPNMPYRRTLMTLFAEHYEQENADRIERIMRTKREQAETHQIIPGSNAPYGYKLVGTGASRALVADPDTEPTLRRLYEHIAAGGTLESLRKALKDERVLRPRCEVARKKAIAAGEEYVPPPNAYNWSARSITHIMKNPTNWGERRSFVHKTHRLTPEERAAPVPGRRSSHKSPVGSRIVPVEQQYSVDSEIHDALIPRDLADRALAQLARNKAYSPRNALPEEVRLERSLLFGGPVRCGLCNRCMRPFKAPHPTTGWLYVCSHHSTSHDGEPQLGIRAQRVDDFAWEHAYKVMRDEAYLRQLVDTSNHIAGPEARRQVLEARLADLDQQHRRLLKTQSKLDPEDPDDDEGFATLAHDINSVARQQKSARRELGVVMALLAEEEQRQERIKSAVSWARSQGSQLEDFSRAERRKALMALGAHVYVHRLQRGKPPSLQLVFDVRGLTGAAALVGDRYKKGHQILYFDDPKRNTDFVEVLGVHGRDVRTAPQDIVPTGEDPWLLEGYATEEEWIAAMEQSYAEDVDDEASASAADRDGSHLADEVGEAQSSTIDAQRPKPTCNSVRLSREWAVLVLA